MDVCEGGMLAYMASSPKLTQGAVSDFGDFYLHANRWFSGAVAAEMEEQWSYVPFAILFPCAQGALTFKAKKKWKLSILNAHHAFWNGTPMEYMWVNPIYKSLNNAYIVI